MRFLIFFFQLFLVNAQHPFEILEPYIKCCRELQTGVATLQTEYTTLAENFLPPDFIYVQFPSLPSPLEMWPMFLWTEVTSQYSSQFFRALGGNSAAFGMEQAESCPKITAFKTFIERGTLLVLPVVDGESPAKMYVTQEGVEGPVSAGTVTADGYSSECRPENFAIRIFKRGGVAPPP